MAVRSSQYVYNKQKMASWWGTESQNKKYTINQMLMLLWFSASWPFYMRQIIDSIFILLSIESLASFHLVLVHNVITIFLAVLNQYVFLSVLGQRGEGGSRVKIQIEILQSYLPKKQGYNMYHTFIMWPKVSLALHQDDIFCVLGSLLTYITRFPIKKSASIVLTL